MHLGLQNFLHTQLRRLLQEIQLIQRLFEGVCSRLEARIDLLIYRIVCDLLLQNTSEFSDQEVSAVDIKY